MKATHPSLFDLAPEQDWNAAVQALRKEAAQQSPTQFYLGLLRLAAMVHDGHTSVLAPAAFRTSAYPIGFAFFGDEFYVTCAAPAYAAAVGKRELASGSASKERFMTDLMPLACGDNERGARERLGGLLRHGDLHQALGMEPTRRDFSNPRATRWRAAGAGIGRSARRPSGRASSSPWSCP